MHKQHRSAVVSFVGQEKPFSVPFFTKRKRHFLDRESAGNSLCAFPEKFRINAKKCGPDKLNRICVRPLGAGVGDGIQTHGLRDHDSISMGILQFRSLYQAPDFLRFFGDFCLSDSEGSCIRSFVNVGKV